MNNILSSTCNNLNATPRTSNPNIPTYYPTLQKINPYITSRPHHGPMWIDHIDARFPPSDPARYGEILRQNPGQFGFNKIHIAESNLDMCKF